MPAIKNRIFSTYTAKCTFEGCGGQAKIEQAQSAGLVLGELVPVDPANPSYGRCPRCRRNQMRIVQTPPPPTRQSPKGFTKIPKE